MVLSSIPGILLAAYHQFSEKVVMVVGSCRLAVNFEIRYLRFY